MTQESYFLDRDYIGTSHSECIQIGDKRLCIVEENTGRRITMVDGQGNICKFPGVVYSQALMAAYGPREIAPQVRYSATFSALPDGTFRMVWTVRPDGRYWMDSWGFGEEDECSVELAARFDKEGVFLEPFRLYKLDGVKIE